MEEINLLDEFQVAIKQSSDACAETIAEKVADKYNMEYHIIEQGGWTQEHKYQYSICIIEMGGEYFKFNQSRSGSYHTDWYYSVDSIEKVEKTEKKTLTVDLDNVNIDAEALLAIIGDADYSLQTYTVWKAI